MNVEYKEKNTNPGTTESMNITIIKRDGRRVDFDDKNQ